MDLESLKNLVLSSGETQIVLALVAIFVLANIIASILFVLYAKFPNSGLRYYIEGIIYELDKFADEMENGVKRKIAVQKINDLLGWKRIVVPSALIELIINSEVATIRKMQSSTNVGNLHEEEIEDAGSNSGTTQTVSTTEQK